MFFRSTYRYAAFFKNYTKAKTSPSPTNMWTLWMKRLAIPTFGMAYYTYMPGSLNQKEEKNWQQQLREEIQPVNI